MGYINCLSSNPAEGQINVCQIKYMARAVCLTIVLFCFCWLQTSCWSAVRWLEFWPNDCVWWRRGKRKFISSSELPHSSCVRWNRNSRKSHRHVKTFRYFKNFTTHYSTFIYGLYEKICSYPLEQLFVEIQMLNPWRQQKENAYSYFMQ